MKKVLAILLFAAMTMSFASCRTDEKKSEDNTEATAAVTEAQDEETETPDDGDSQAPAATGDTEGQILLSVFNNAMEADSSQSAEALANIVLEDPSIKFMKMAMPVEPGLLAGFDNFEVTGFTEGAMFGPAMGSIAFVGYVFTLDPATDADAFIADLKANANPRWNICVEAEETIVENNNGKVFFLMCPKSLEE